MGHWALSLIFNGSLGCGEAFPSDVWAIQFPVRTGLDMRVVNPKFCSHRPEWRLGWSESPGGVLSIEVQGSFCDVS